MMMKAARKIESDPTMEWFAKADLSAYRGLYVAIVDCAVAASGRNAKRVFAQAKRRFPGREITLWKEPDADILLL